jgi:putative methyltransferase (TIGR04325 family)
MLSNSSTERTRAPGLQDFDARLDSWPSDFHNPFDSVEWLDSAEVYLAHLFNLGEQDRLPIEHYIVPICMLSAVAARKNGEVRVLDFGGGVGVNYVNLRAGLPQGVAIHYDIVDSAANRGRWEKHSLRMPECRYHDEIPHDTTLYDIVFASSTLQYVQEWKAVLSAIANKTSGWLVLPRLPITTGKTFIARQNIRFLNGPHAGKSAGSAPHWFVNRQELLDILSGVGHHLVHDHYISDYGAEITHLERPPGDATLRVMSFAAPQSAARPIESV